MSVCRYASTPQVKEGSISIALGVVLSVFLFTMTGCAAFSPPSSAKQETGKTGSAVKPAKHDEEKSMNEESQRGIMDR